LALTKRAEGSGRPVADSCLGSKIPKMYRRIRWYKIQTKENSNQHQNFHIPSQGWIMELIDWIIWLVDQRNWLSWLINVIDWLDRSIKYVTKWVDWSNRLEWLIKLIIIRLIDWSYYWSD
jgi:hypothetical protein